MLKKTSAFRRPLTGAGSAIGRQARYLHYDPNSLSRSREAIREPQEIKYYYKYRYTPYMNPEMFAWAQYIHQEPYYLHQFYDWENYLPSKYGEWWTWGPGYVYAFYFFVLFGLFLYSFFRSVAADKYRLTPMEHRLIWDNTLFYGTPIMEER